jgi:protein-disulfide isomerase
VVRAAVAAVALTVAMATESTLNQAIAEAAAQRTRHHHQHGGSHPAHHPRPEPAKPKPVAAKPLPGPVFADVPDRKAALALPARLDPDRVTIDVGYPDAPVQLTLFEDYRCSETARFEALQGPTLRALIARHTVLVHYVIESSLDERLPGPGALFAANAARAALAHGGFPLLHALLLANQGPEDLDGFTPQRLLDLASHVPGLRGPGFDSEVRALYWKPWVDAAQHLYDVAGVHHGTPSMLLNGSEVDLGTRPELLESPSALQSFVQNAANRGE